MQSEWYGDKRDLVKWSVLLTVAKQEHLNKIIQVGYFRENTWGGFYIDTQGKKENHEIPAEVIRHFRDITGIEKLSTKEIKIEYFGEKFLKRGVYQKNLLNWLSQEKANIVLFLDPDTGMEPEISKATLEHVLRKELEEIWNYLTRGSVLVLYQHRFFDKKWIEKTKKRISDSLKIPPDEVVFGYGPRIAGDVVFFIIKKLR